MVVLRFLGPPVCAATPIRTDTNPATYDEFRGDKRFLINLELRTRPLLFLSSFWGLVLFYDAGDAFDEWAQPEKEAPDYLAFRSFNPRSGAGIGLRLLMPQLDRSVFRIDLGFPLNRDDPRGEFTFIAAFGQAINGPAAYPSALILQ